MNRTLIAFLTVPLLLAGCTTAQAPEVSHAASAPSAELRTGMVSAADPRAAEAGAEMLRRGGSATDAAIATMLALNVVEPQSSGIGGGGFYVRGTRDGKVETLDGRETAPAAAGPDWFLDAEGKPLGRKEAMLSGLSIGVPGNLALVAEAHRRHGKLPWAELFEPAIRLAREGWTATERFHSFLARVPDRAGRGPAGKALYFDDSGEPVATGTALRNPVLADTLERIAKAGPDTFYRGPQAEAMAAKVQADTPRPQAMTSQDVAAYEAKWRTPVCGTYRVYRICGMGPPSSGATTVIAILGQLEAFDMAGLGPDSPVAWHLFAESQRLAYADRERYLGDDDFVSVPVAGLTDHAYLARRGALIAADRSLAKAEPGTPDGVTTPPPDGDEPKEHGTSHFVVVDREGNAVSYTSTVEGPFGSGLMFGGFYLNNELTDFSFTPDKDGRPVANRVEGGKRPRSSMSPTLVYGPDGKLFLAVGAAGGATIPVQVARVLIGVIDWKLPIGDALALPVLFSPGDRVFLEKGSVLEAMIPQLNALGHDQIMAVTLPLKTNAIEVTASGLIGAADPRSEGTAISE